MRCVHDDTRRSSRRRSPSRLDHKPSLHSFGGALAPPLVGANGREVAGRGSQGIEAVYAGAGLQGPKKATQKSVESLPEAAPELGSTSDPGVEKARCAQPDHLPTPRVIQHELIGRQGFDAAGPTRSLRVIATAVSTHEPPHWFRASITLLCMGLSRFVPWKASRAQGSRSEMGTRSLSSLGRELFGGGM